jgi:MoxR-like ATPase
LFYTFDALNAFKAGAGDTKQFIEYQALGRAIIEAFPKAEVEHLLAPGAPHKGPQRSVVLIDEIDKAPRDFPNDILNEIERLFFRLPELGPAGASPGADDERVKIPGKYRPIVVLTSNSEKGLPDPFLRRCVYFHIPFPSADEMRTIVDARVARLFNAPPGKTASSAPLLIDAISLFYGLRKPDRSLGAPAGPTASLKKQPSTAEFLNWLQILSARGMSLDQGLKSRKQLVVETLSTLVKNPEDLESARKFVNEKWGAAG